MQPMQPLPLTKTELDQRLWQVVHAAPIIRVGPAYPIQSFEGWNDPYPSYYRGARVVVDEGLSDKVFVQEINRNPTD